MYCFEGGNQKPLFMSNIRQDSALLNVIMIQRRKTISDRSGHYTDERKTVGIKFTENQVCETNKAMFEKNKK